MKLACSIAGPATVAVSGGPDSMSLLSFLLRSTARKKDNGVRAIFINHGTKFSIECEALVSKYCADNDVELRVFSIEPGCSEAVWSFARRRIYDKETTPVFTGHTLDDAVEWYLYSTIKGSTNLMPAVSGNVRRPLLFTNKKWCIEWCGRNDVPYLIDPTNLDGVSNMRSMIRSIMPTILNIHPGLHSTVKRLYKEGNNETMAG